MTSSNPACGANTPGRSQAPAAVFPGSVKMRDIMPEQVRQWYSPKPRKNPPLPTALGNSSQSMFEIFRLFSTPRNSGDQRNGDLPLMPRSTTRSDDLAKSEVWCPLRFGDHLLPGVIAGEVRPHQK